MDWRTRPVTSLPALLTLLLSGCGGVLSAPHIYSLALTAPSETPSHSAPMLPGVVSVLRPSTDSVLNSRQIAWRSNPTALSVGNYADYQWASTPAETTQLHIGQCLESMGVAGSVTTDSMPVDADWLISGRLHYFEQQLTGAAEAQARVAVELTLTRVRSPRKPLWHDVIDVAVPLPDAHPEQIAAGIQRALRLLCPRLRSSLSRVIVSPAAL